MQYQLFYWRKQMNASYEDMMNTPLTLIMQDIEIISLENQYGQKEGVA